MNFESKLQYCRSLKTLKLDRSSSFLLYDRKLRKGSQEMRSFIDGFPNALGVAGGESLKSVENFSNLVRRVMASWKGPLSRQSLFLTFGGGSVGDIGGFLASTLKRGVPLVHIPSTWLSAVDSAHGGKTGLNVAGVKNQLGTFYPAQKVIMVAQVLRKQPEVLAQDAVGEYLKMGLLSQDELFLRMSCSRKQGHAWCWSFLKPTVNEKYKIVLKDPYEKTTVRQRLNFGHTLGHVLEAELGLSHGKSVLHGLYFALCWSRHSRRLSQSQFGEIDQILRTRFQYTPLTELKSYRPLSRKKARLLLSKDKKLSEQGDVGFVFLKKIGRPSVELVNGDHLLDFAMDEGWVR